MAENIVNTRNQANGTTERSKDVSTEIGALACNFRLWWTIDVTDVGFRELFVIDGDSLLANFLWNSTKYKLGTNTKIINRKDRLPWPQFFSSLQLIWLIERFLTELQLRNGMFDIVFFESNACVWIVEDNPCESYKLLTIRRMVIDHLKKYFRTKLPIGGKVLGFDHTGCEKWLEYYRSAEPRFVLMNIDLTNKHKLSNKLAEIWKMTCVDLIHRGCSVVTFDKFCLEGNRAVASIATSTSLRRLNANVDILKIQTFANDTFNRTAEFLNQLWLETGEAGDFAASALKLLAADIADEKGRQFCFFLCIYQVVVRHLPLKHRIALHANAVTWLSDHSVPENLKKMLSKFYISLFKACSAFQMSNIFDSSKLPDVIDDLLLFGLLYECRKSPDSRKLLGTKCLEKASEFAKSLFPGKKNFTFQPEQLLDQIPKLWFSTNERTSELLLSGFENDFFKDLLQPLLQLKLSDVKTIGSDENLVSFLENKHWHAGRKPLEIGSSAKYKSSTLRNERGKPATSSNVSALAKLYNDVEKEHGNNHKLLLVKRATVSMKNNPLLQEAFSAVSVYLLTIQLYESCLNEQMNAKNYSNVIPIRTDVLECVQEAVSWLPKLDSVWLRQEAVKILCGCLNKFGFDKCSAQLATRFETGNTDMIVDRSSLSFKYKSVLRGSHSEAVAASYSDFDFQMLFCGHLFDRSSDACPDPKQRVDFTPDKWQLELLDAVDNNESAFVFAPTSSGKTFVAFYAMEKVLRSNTDQIVVYVSPTKAVVNQVVEEVKTRNPEHINRIGVYTRDFRHREFNCNVLICVAQILEILLLSPAWQQKNRLKWIIFDEVHSMGERNSGVVWEHLLLLSPCPVLALSASIANFEQVFQWAEEAQRRKGFTLRKIVSNRRYCELQKWIYASTPVVSESADESPETIEEETPWITTAYRSREAIGNIIRVNPFAGVSSSALRNFSFPPNLKLLPDECVRIYQKLSRAAEKHKIKDGQVLETLCLDKFFAGKGFLTRADAELYENRLKEAVLTLVRGKTSHHNLVDDVARKLDANIGKLAHGRLDKCIDQDTIRQEFPKLLRNLRSQELLPAIIFCLDREVCHTLCRTAVDHMKKLKEDSHSTFSPRGRERNFTLAETTRQQVKIQQAVSYLKRTLLQGRKDENHEFLVEALSYGIGVHHGGLPAQYRAAVETLFREKNLSAVIATGTLACGINAPCRSVVFAIDTIHLDSVNHLQMMGRAGRRGFDKVGHVVYFGLSFQRVKQLLCWPLQPLVANFPVSASLVLRTLCLESETQPPDHAAIKKSIHELYNSSFFSNGRKIAHLQILHMVGFSIEYFLRRKLINKNGQLVELAGLVSHTFYVEPSNMAFAALISSGCLNTLLLEHRSTKIQSKSDCYLEIFASFFNRERVAKSKLKEKSSYSDAMIELPRLPDAAICFIENYNRDLLSVVSTCFQNYARKNLQLTEDCTLPLSQLNYDYKDSPLGSLLEVEVPQHDYVRSLFGRLGSSNMMPHPDDFSDNDDLASNVRAGIFLDRSAIPVFDVWQIPVNAYICDFASHGDMKRIEDENGVKSGYVYQKLYDADMLLWAIASSLERIAQKKPADYEYVSRVAMHAAVRFREKMNAYSYMKPPNNLLEENPFK